MPLPLTTDRLTIRAPRRDDLHPLRELFGDPEAMRYIGTGAPRDEARMRESLDRKLAVLQESPRRSHGPQGRSAHGYFP